MSDSNNLRKKDFAKKPDKLEAGKSTTPSKDVQQVSSNKSDRKKTVDSASEKLLDSPNSNLKKKRKKEMSDMQDADKTGVQQESLVEQNATNSTPDKFSNPGSPSSSGDSEDSQEEARDTLETGVLFDSKGKPVDLDAFIQASVQAHLKKGYLPEVKKPVENPKRAKANKSKGNFITYSICVFIFQSFFFFSFFLQAGDMASSFNLGKHMHLSPIPRGLIRLLLINNDR